MKNQCWNPWVDLATLPNQVSDIFEDIARHQQRREDAEACAWRPAADIYETAEEFVIALDAPGMERDKFDISLEDKYLTVTGTRATEGEKHRRRERPNGNFARRFKIHANLDRDNIVAEYKDGVLRVRLPRKAAPEAQRVTINVA